MDLITRRTLFTAVTASAAAVLTGCAQAPSSSRGQGAAFTAAADLAEPGTTIPEINLKASFPPWGDELLGVAGIDIGYYKAVGITITPEPYGAQQDLLSNLTPLVNGQVELGGGYVPTIANQIDTVKNVVGFAVSDVSYVYRIVAPKGKYRTVAQEMAAGNDFKTALTAVMAQLKGQKLICVDGGSPLFRNTVAEAAGLDLDQDVKVEFLANPDIVKAGFAGQADFLSPSSAGFVVQLQQNGWEPLVDLRQVIDNLPSQDTVPLRFTYSGLVTTTEYAEQNFETLLRFTSVIYRLIDDLQTDPEETAGRFVEYLNSYTGTEITAKELAGTFDNIYSLRNFDEAGDFYTDSDDPFFFDTVATANLEVLSRQGVIKEGHTPDELSIAGKVYEALVRYKKEADKALAAAPDGELKKQAQEQYDARNYLDAYRFAAAANQ
ncbi:ABC transporter substrate-binding protein [Kineosporia babensis]|uniref:ABC transporter substrate-binding protein n=1 Tax=Kineosporia babensis TaxID=499548 RepID=A0A9X1NHJ1_9ACTN|nr:hypothetical protein [Kineosporia babensis]MCD5314258.1 hypothetical protein [Kineosporia babensis]